jgi:hypothetical protein
MTRHQPIVTRALMTATPRHLLTASPRWASTRVVTRGDTWDSRLSFPSHGSLALRCLRLRPQSSTMLRQTQLSRTRNNSRACCPTRTLPGSLAMPTFVQFSNSTHFCTSQASELGKLTCYYLAKSSMNRTESLCSFYMRSACHCPARARQADEYRSMPPLLYCCHTAVSIPR